MNILIIALTVALALALALWIASLPANMPAYTRPTFYLGLVVVAAIVILMQLPA
jgi:predicted signal transduction protein with EAL and GGDEF domain